MQMTGKTSEKRAEAEVSSRVLTETSEKKKATSVISSAYNEEKESSGRNKRNKEKAEH